MPVCNVALNNKITKNSKHDTERRIKMEKNRDDNAFSNRNADEDPQLIKCQTRNAPSENCSSCDEKKPHLHIYLQHQTR